MTDIRTHYFGDGCEPPHTSLEDEATTHPGMNDALRASYRASIIRNIEARRHEADDEVTRQAEEGLSVNDWIDRIKGAVRQAQTSARAGDTDLEEDAWTELASIAITRIEQLAWMSFQENCPHSWPEDVRPETRCPTCGIMWGEKPPEG
jgi:hypothetical protein